VQVLLATYNGAKYLEDLIESIWNQSGINEISILASDDKSTDSSRKILCNFGITILDGPMNGAAANFRHLITSAGGHDFYAFADQDDFWYPDKISSAVSEFKETLEPTIYVGSTIDTNGKICAPEIYTLPESLMSNQVQGCTIVINDRFLQLLKKNLPTSFIMHDWWIYNLAQCFGKIIVDKKPCMTYRLHGGNLIGTNSKLLKIFRLLKKLTTGEHYVEVLKQAQCLTQLPTRNANTKKIESWVQAMEGNLFTRIKYLVKAKLNFNSILKKIFYSFVVITGKYKTSTISIGTAE
jgi:rhamnosyltransferase